MATTSANWQWSDEHLDHYYVTRAHDGSFIYHWARQQQQPQQPQQQQQQQWQQQQRQLNPTGYQYHANPQSYALGHQPTATEYQPTRAGAEVRPRGDSAMESLLPTMVPKDERNRVPDLITGTSGAAEHLDKSYFVRSGSEAHRFFKVGKVFMMLHVQAASLTYLQSLSDNITVVQYGEHAFSQIRRFVIVSVRRGFVYACAISTYSGRATLKRGCIPSEHSIIYVEGAHPVMYDGEALTKAPIAVRPAASEPNLVLKPASRLHYGKAYPVEMNVKVKDLGDVVPEDLTNLLAYYIQENS